MKSRIAYQQIAAYFLLLVLMTSCSIQRKINLQAKKILIESPELNTAHVGISIYDDSSKAWLYNYQGDHFFIPSSNTKLFTLYAGLKFLQDSLVAARVAYDNGTLIVQATGDPTFLHPDFAIQPLLNYLQNESIEVIRLNIAFASQSFGDGWSWDDFQAPFMAERDPFPMYGNVATVKFADGNLTTIPPSIRPFVIGMPEYEKPWSVTRDLGGHMYTIDNNTGTIDSPKKMTMSMNKGLYASRYLGDTLHKTVLTEYNTLPRNETTPIYSQPKDSLFKIMMHRSDNFFAEQTLLMAAEAYLGEMNDGKMIDSILKSVLQDIPQKPRWVDGSGLSRYNLFTPRDMVYILQKLQSEFGIQRMKNILPTANEGTLKGRFNGYENRIFAKTGSLSNNISLSGYLITNKNKQLTFSIMVNNFRADSSNVRKEIEHFLTGIIEQY